MNWFRKRPDAPAPRPDTRTVDVVGRLELVADRMDVLATEIEAAIRRREEKRYGAGT